VNNRNRIHICSAGLQKISQGISKWKVAPLLHVPVTGTGQAKVEQLPIKIY